MMIVDSSVWVALYNEFDSQHRKALSFSTAFVDVAVAEYVLLETSTLLLSKAGVDVAEKFLEYSLNSAEVTVLYSSPEFLQETARLFRGLKNKRLSFVDISLLLLSESHEVVTFDKALQKAIQKQ